MDFVSFGPCCLSGELLKALELRSCSYGFDWSRSGSLEHRDFLKLGATKFFNRYVVNPVIRLRQSSSPHSSPTKTAEVEQAKPVYGYPYTYNPHRGLDSQSELDYLARCYKRLDERIKLFKTKPFTIILSDYTNKSGYTYFKDPYISAKYLLSLFQLYKSISPRIRIMRYTIAEEASGETVRVEEMDTGDLISVIVPLQIDNIPKTRRQYYQKLYPLFL